MTFCVKCYLLYLVGCLLFGDRSNKWIELVYLTTMEEGYVGMRNYSWGGMTLEYLYGELAEAWRQSSWGKRDTAHCKKLINVNLNFFFLLYFLCVKIYKCDLFGLCKHGFWRIFLAFSVDPNTDYIENYPVAARWKLQKGHGEGLTYRSLLDRIQFDDVCWRPYEEHREFQGFEEVFWYSGWIMCDVRRVYRHLPERVLRQYRYVQSVPRHPTDVVELTPPQIVQAFVDFRTHKLKEPHWGHPAGEQTWRMADGYVLWYTKVSHPQILPPLPGDLLRPANEELIIAEQWERYEARSSPDNYDMVSAAVAYANAQMGQEEVMSHQQWFQAMSHIREQIAPILTRRRGQRPRRRQQQHQQDHDQ